MTQGDSALARLSMTEPESVMKGWQTAPVSVENYQYF